MCKVIYNKDKNVVQNMLDIVDSIFRTIDDDNF